MLNKKDPFSTTIYRLGHAEQIFIDQELAPYHLRMNHARVLDYLHRHPGSLQKEVAAFLDYQQASTTNLINQLEKRQMLVRKPDPNNGRQKRLYLLPKGKAIVQKTDQIFIDLNRLIGEVAPEVNRQLNQKLAILRQKITKKWYTKALFLSDQSTTQY